MRTLLASLVLAAVVTAAGDVAFADDPAFERVLVPISVSYVPGAYGTLWSTELWYRNNSDRPVAVYPLTVSNWVPTIRRTHPLPIGLRPPDRPGLVLHVTRALADQVQFDLRLLNGAADLNAWGTKLPVVRESEFADVVSLINVPTAPALRATLRVYGLVDEAPRSETITVRVFAPDERLLGAIELPFDAAYVSDPQYAAIQSLGDALPAMREVDRVRLEIESHSGAARLWAFVAVVSNLTQEVTLVTPD
jgi:hypothetical protein